MSVQKYHSIDEMPPPPRSKDPLRTMAGLWDLAHLRGKPRMKPGVQRFRTIEEAQRARLEDEAQRLRHARGDERVRG